jgi:HEAT repeat protein
MGSRALGAIPVLEELLAKSDNCTRDYAAEALIQIDASKRSAVVRPMIECLEDKEVHVRVHAADVLGKCGKAASRSVTRLVQMIADGKDDWEVRTAAIVAVREIDPRSVDFRKGLKTVLRDATASAEGGYYRREAVCQAFDAIRSMRAQGTELLADIRHFEKNIADESMKRDAQKLLSEFESGK